MDRGSDSTFAQQTRRVRDASRGQIHAARMSDDRRDATGQSVRQLLDGAVAGLHKSFTEQQIARRVPTHDKLGCHDESGAIVSSPFGGLHDKLGIASDVSHCGIELSQCNSQNDGPFFLSWVRIDEPDASSV